MNGPSDSNKEGTEQPVDDKFIVLDKYIYTSKYTIILEGMVKGPTDESTGGSQLVRFGDPKATRR